MTFADHLERIGYRGPGFDRIRLIAALIVVLHHCSFYAMSDISNDALARATGGAIDFGRLAVNIFFVTSGVLVAPGLLKSGDLTTFTINRALRVMPALIVVVGTTVFLVGPAITKLTVGQYFSDMETYRYLKNIAFRAVRYLPGVETPDGARLIVNGALWTIYFEILSYVALVVMFVSGIFTRPAILLLAFAATYALYLYSYVLPANPLALPDTLLVFGQLFIYFLAGVLISALAAHIAHGWKIAAFFVLLSAISFPLGIVYYTFPISISYIIAYVGYSNLLGGRTLKIDLSYGIYLIHSVVITVLIVLAPQLDSFLVATVVVIATTAALALVSWLMVEEPSLRRKKAVSAASRRLVALVGTRSVKPDPSRGKP